MAAPVVSGTLALMQEFFETRLGQSFSPRPLQGAAHQWRASVSPDYNFQVRSTINSQGWGLIGLTNSIPEILATNRDQGTWPLRFFADPVANVLATGEQHTWTLRLTEEARFVPLRATLVWTDPPGTPRRQEARQRPRSHPHQPRYRRGLRRQQHPQGDGLHPGHRHQRGRPLRHRQQRRERLPRAAARDQLLDHRRGPTRPRQRRDPERHGRGPGLRAGALRRRPLHHHPIVSLVGHVPPPKKPCRP